jgi:hypothetical protein
MLKRALELSKTSLFLQFLQFPDERLGPFRTETEWLLASLIPTTDGVLVETWDWGRWEH